MKRIFWITLVCLFLSQSFVYAEKDLLHVAGVKQRLPALEYKDGKTKQAKLEWPYKITYGKGTLYLLDGTSIRTIKNDKVTTIANLHDHEDFFKDKGIDPEIIDYAAYGSMVYKNDKLFIGALMLDQDWEKPFSGWMYQSIWRYDIKKDKLDVLYFEKADYEEGPSSLNTFYETDTGLHPGLSYRSDNTAYFYHGAGRHLGRLYVDDKENIYGVWEKDDRVHPYMLTNKGELINLYPKKEIYHAVKFYEPGRYPNWVQSSMVIPNGDGTYRYYDGVQHIVDIDPKSETITYPIKKSFTKLYTYLKRPVVDQNDNVHFLTSHKETNPGGIHTINYTYANKLHPKAKWVTSNDMQIANKVWNTIYTPDEIIGNKIGEIADYTFDEKGNIILLSFSNRQIYKLK